MFNKKTQPKNKQSINKNTLESLVNIGGGVMGSFAQDVVKDSFTGFFDQILKGGSEQQIVNPGKYHVSFFEWVLLLVRQARMKVEDSSAWLGAFKSKKAKKQYWSMFKKHGTTFGLSNERVVSTQTG